MTQETPLFDMAGEQTIAPAPDFTMNGDSGTEESLRQIALRLHSLNPQDQAWVLQRLPQSVRRRVLPMLQEVSAIGFPRDRGWLQQVPPTAAELCALYDPALPEPVNRINQASLERIKTVLAEEPDGVIATVLAYYRWVWLEPFLKQCKVPQRRRIVAIARQIRQHKRMPMIEATVQALSRQLQLNGDDKAYAAIDPSMHDGVLATERSKL